MQVVMVMVVNSQIGADLSREWLFRDGDLIVVENEDNLNQAISNRLNTYIGSLNLFYEEYGTFLTELLGMQKDGVTLQFIQLEITKRLSNDPRLQNFTVSCDYTDNGVKVDVDIIFDDNTDYALNYVLNEDTNLVEVG